MNNEFEKNNYHLNKIRIEIKIESHQSVKVKVIYSSFDNIIGLLYQCSNENDWMIL